MTVSTTESGYAGNGPRCADKRKVKQPVQGRWHDQVDNGSKEIDNGPESRKTKSLKYLATFIKKSLFRVCGLMTKTLAPLELSLYERYGALPSLVL